MMNHVRHLLESREASTVLENKNEHNAISLLNGEFGFYQLF